VAWPLMTRPPEAPTAVAGGALPTADGRWHPWSAEQVQALQAQGTPVFVDFTAAWCVTCQVNKSTSLRRTEVLQAAQAQGVVLMVADWTRQDPIISQALNRLGRTGVPVYAMHRPGQAAPEVLPELLTPERVIQAFSGR